MSPHDIVWPVRFDEDALDEDLQRLTPNGRRAIAEARVSLEAHGVPHASLRATAGQLDGTDLTNCVKLRIPDTSDGTWGPVLEFERVNGVIGLRVLAAGERHPTVAWRPSVYAIAHRRLHG